MVEMKSTWVQHVTNWFSYMTAWENYFNSSHHSTTIFTMYHAWYYIVCEEFRYYWFLKKHPNINPVCDIYKLIENREKLLLPHGLGKYVGWLITTEAALLLRIYFTKSV